MTSTAPNLNTKSHFQILDGLRGVAALLVVTFHTFEAYAEGSVFKQHLNHGYLAVDFFFLLSGFVIAYAYDDRWSRMSVAGFFTRRLIRLQPMVVAGSVLGAALFYTQASPLFPTIHATPVWQVVAVMLLGCTLLPLPLSMDIRGWGEMHPLDGPAWSLFFEYLANIAYALGLRKVSNRVLALLTTAAALYLAQVLLFGPRGDVIGGWALNSSGLHVGSARLLYPFLAGLLLERLTVPTTTPAAPQSTSETPGLTSLTSSATTQTLSSQPEQSEATPGAPGLASETWVPTPTQSTPIADTQARPRPRQLHLRHAFPLCSLLLVVSFSLPRFGGPAHLWINGLYELLCILVLFPLIVTLGAGDTLSSPRSIRLCRFLGDISYPLYITHYPLIYCYTAYVLHHHTPGPRGALIGAPMILLAILIAYLCLRFYDEPVRAALTRRFLPRTPKPTPSAPFPTPSPTL